MSTTNCELESVTDIYTVWVCRISKNAKVLPICATLPDVKPQIMKNQNVLERWKNISDKILKWKEP